MYLHNEELILLENIGKEGSPKFLPKGSTVLFVKAIDTSDLAKSYLQVSIGDRLLVIPELSVKRKDEKAYEKALKEFNQRLVKSDPNLLVHHPNWFLRLFYRFLDLFNKKPKKPVDLSRIKNIIRED